MRTVGAASNILYMRLIIAGSRTFKDYSLLKEKVNDLLSELMQPVEAIVSGTAKGADQLGERYAKEYGYKIKQFFPDWSAHGMSAGFKRNKQMAEYATHCICFWDGDSRGTEMMIELSQKNRLPTKVILFKPYA